MLSKNPYIYKQNNKNILEKKDTIRRDESIVSNG